MQVRQAQKELVSPAIQSPAGFVDLRNFSQKSEKIPPGQNLARLFGRQSLWSHLNCFAIFDASPVIGLVNGQSNRIRWERMLNDPGVAHPVRAVQLTGDPVSSLQRFFFFQFIVTSGGF